MSFNLTVLQATSSIGCLKKTMPCFGKCMRTLEAHLILVDAKYQGFVRPQMSEVMLGKGDDEYCQCGGFAITSFANTKTFLLSRTDSGLVTFTRISDTRVKMDTAFYYEGTCSVKYYISSGPDFFGVRVGQPPPNIVAIVVPIVVVIVLLCCCCCVMLGREEKVAKEQAQSEHLQQDSNQSSPFGEATEMPALSASQRMNIVTVEVPMATAIQVEGDDQIPMAVEMSTVVKQRHETVVISVV